MQTFLAALVFYTALPVAVPKNISFFGVARWLPVVGLLIGEVLAGADWLFGTVFPDGVRAVLVLCVWVVITAGFHLDGVMDTADGLAVSDSEMPSLSRRLDAMADSHTGAFGAIALVLLMLFKFSALMALPTPRWVVLVFAPAWARWGQLMAIALYPYAKERGKGWFLRVSTRMPQDVWPSTLLLLGLFILCWSTTSSPIALAAWIGGTAIVTMGVGYWLYRQLGGHTGDTYGAVVEWTEAISLVMATAAWSLLGGVS